MPKLHKKPLAVNLKRKSLPAFRRAMIRLLNRANKHAAQCAKSFNNGYSSKLSVKATAKIKGKRIQFFTTSFTMMAP